MSMLNFYINRAGTNLPEERRRVLEQAKKSFAGSLVVEQVPRCCGKRVEALIRSREEDEESLLEDGRQGGDERYILLQDGMPIRLSSLAGEEEQHGPRQVPGV